MPNGGMICCDRCAFGRRKDRLCDIFGTEVSVHLVCRSYRVAKQSHREARKEWPVLQKLEPGIVYAIHNSTYADWDPKPWFRVVPIHDEYGHDDG
jgi:hypothetical protein